MKCNKKGKYIGVEGECQVRLEFYSLVVWINILLQVMYIFPTLVFWVDILLQAIFICVTAGNIHPFLHNYVNVKI